MNSSPVRIAQIMGIMENGGVEAIVMNYDRAIDHDLVQFDFFVDETSSFPQRAEIELLGGRCYLVPSYTHPIRYIRALKRLFRENGYTIVHAQIRVLARCYHGGDDRTQMKPLCYKKRDHMAYVILAAYLAVAIGFRAAGI